jgi:hypothetical protein
MAQPHSTAALRRRPSVSNSLHFRYGNPCEAQWLAYAFPYRRFAITLVDDRARLSVNAVFSATCRTSRRGRSLEPSGPVSMTEMEKLNRRVELSQNSERQNGGYDQHRPKLRLCSALWKMKFHNEIPNSAAVLIHKLGQQDPSQWRR